MISYLKCCVHVLINAMGTSCLRCDPPYGGQGTDCAWCETGLMKAWLMWCPGALAVKRIIWGLRATLIFITFTWYLLHTSKDDEIHCLHFSQFFPLFNNVFISATISFSDMLMLITALLINSPIKVKYLHLSMPFSGLRKIFRAYKGKHIIRLKIG